MYVCIIFGKYLEYYLKSKELFRGFTEQWHSTLSVAISAHDKSKLYRYLIEVQPDRDT